jgi:hypothetical protein
LTRYSSTSSRITFQLESWTEPTYDPFVRPPAADALADATIRPIKAHLQIPDACLDTWISSGRWRGSCIRVPVEESPIDLVYIWVNGSYVCNSRAGRALTFASLQRCISFRVAARLACIFATFDLKCPLSPAR